MEEQLVPVKRKASDSETESATVGSLSDVSASKGRGLSKTCIHEVAVPKDYVSPVDGSAHGTFSDPVYRTRRSSLSGFVTCTSNLVMSYIQTSDRHRCNITCFMGGTGLYLVVDENEQFKEGNFVKLQETFAEQISVKDTVKSGGNRARILKPGNALLTQGLISTES